jgi:hypothetical protein
MAFHVTETARMSDVGRFSSSPSDGNNGAFWLSSPEPGWHLLAIASDGGEWEHVSVSARRGDQVRTPSWKEMAYAKGLFWDAEDVVIQYHPRKSEYVNCHPNVLHLWRPVGAEIPTPPAEYVGPLQEAKEQT